MRSLPHELSGGQRQRVMIAMALANDPDLLIADEPTTALDVTIQAEILMLLAELQKRLGMAIVFITHDLTIVEAFCHHVYVMRRGRVVEEGPTAEIFEAPREDYTKMLLAAEPEGTKAPVPLSAPALLSAHDVRVTFTRKPGLLGRGGFELVAVKDVSLTIRRGQTLGIVGRVWVRQVDARPGAREPPAGWRARCVRGDARERPRAPGDEAVAATPPDGFPGPLRLAVAAHDGGRHRRRRADGARAAALRAGAGAAGGGGAGGRRARGADAQTASRTSSPAGSASGSRSPARWC
jgi:hypothetical protein